MDIKIAKPVLLSVTLLLAVHGIGLWEMIQLSRALGVSIWMPYSVLAIVYGLLAGVLVMILRGERWARTTYACVAVLAFLSVLGHAADLSAWGFGLIAAKVLAVVLLYVPASADWFNREQSLARGTDARS
jgi:hypothetical protein